MSEVDDDALCVHGRDEFTSQWREAGVLGLQTAVAEHVAHIVGKLHDAQPEGVIERETFEIGADRHAILEAVNQPELVLLFRGRQIGGRANLQEQIRMPLEITLPPRHHRKDFLRCPATDGEVYGGDARRAHVCHHLRRERGDVEGCVERPRTGEEIDHHRAVVTGPRRARCRRRVERSHAVPRRTDGQGHRHLRKFTS